MSAHEMTADLARRNGPRVLGDRIYFTGFSLFILILIFWAFAPTYFLAGAYHKPAPPPFIVVHGR